MPYLSKNRVWTQQPQYRVEIEWENPITQGLALSMSPVNGFADVVTGEQYIPFGTAPVISIGAFGKCLDSITDWGGIRISPARNICTVEQTHILLVECVQRNYAYGGIFACANANGTSGSFTVQDNGGNIFAVFTSYPIGTTLPSNIPFGPSMIVISGDASGSIAYKDGETIMASGPAPAVKSDSRFVLSGESSADANYATKCRIYFHASFTRRLSVAEIKSITRNPWQIFKKKDRRIWIPSASGGVHTTTSILTSDVATISGTSLHKILHTVVGNLTSSAATLTGTSVHTTPSPTHNTVGVLSASNSSITGIAARYREHQTTGILTTTNATINGTTNNFSVITSTGVLSSNVATLAGVMSITPAPGIHISTGVLQSNSSTITGILTHTATGHTLTGTLVSSVATLNGNVAHNTIHSSSGTLVSSVATINGTASSSGIITLTPADIEAIANAVWQHPWALTLPKWLALK